MSPFTGTLPIRKARTTAESRYVEREYLQEGRPGREVAAELGRTYGSFKRFISQNENLKKSRSGQALALA